jgi:hypothetical protein
MTYALRFLPEVEEDIMVGLYLVRREGAKPRRRLPANVLCQYWWDVPQSIALLNNVSRPLFFRSGDEASCGASTLRD